MSPGHHKWKILALNGPVLREQVKACNVLHAKSIPDAAPENAFQLLLPQALAKLNLALAHEQLTMWALFSVDVRLPLINGDPHGCQATGAYPIRRRP
jgi:hypothetical protein